MVFASAPATTGRASSRSGRRSCAIHITLWLTMRFSVQVIRVIKDSGVTLVTRIAGLLLSAIAVQMVADAVRAFIKAGEGDLGFSL